MRREFSAKTKRIVRSAKLLGLSADEILSLMQWMDYANEHGEPYNKNIQRVWAVPSTDGK